MPLSHPGENPGLNELVGKFTDVAAADDFWAGAGDGTYQLWTTGGFAGYLRSSMFRENGEKKKPIELLPSPPLQGDANNQ